MGLCKDIYIDASEYLEEELGRKPTDKEVIDYVSSLPDYAEYMMEDR